MSQEKVDRYKESKKNRKQEIKKAKRNRWIGRTVGVIIAAVMVVWIVASGYRVYQNSRPVAHTEVNMDAITDYLGNLTASTE